MAKSVQQLSTRRTLQEYYQSSERYKNSLLAHDELLLNQYIDLISRYVAAQAPLLDLGCGIGLSTEMLHKRGYNAVGVDISPLFLGVGKERWGTNLACGDALQLPFEDERFAAVAAFEFIEHIPDVPALLNEIHRILRPGGFIILNSPNLLSPYSPAKSLVQMFRGKGGKSAFASTPSEALGWLTRNLYLSLRKSYSSEVNFLYKEPDLSERKVGGDADSVYLANQLDLSLYLRRYHYKVHQLASGRSSINRLSITLTPHWAPWMGFVAQKPSIMEQLDLDHHDL